jgi:site-specific recombinase XerD
MERLIAQCREYIAELGYKYCTANDIKNHILRKNETKNGKFIDFIAFCESRNKEIEKKKGKNGTYYMNSAAINHLKRFYKSNSININEISKKILEKFEDYLMRQKTGQAGISANLRAIRTFFIAAMDEYNDESMDEYIIGLLRN